MLTIGSTANQNGTALFEGVTVLFLAQFYGVELTLGQQVAGAGHLHPGRHRHRGRAGRLAAGGGDDPRAWSACRSRGSALILGVDRFLDMCRTTLNVTGDLAAAVVVSRGEGGVAAPATPVLPPSPAS